MKMSLFVCILLFIVANCDSSSIRIKQNVTKREVDSNFFPNWVPFKNKHGDELGEFVDVSKPKPKKRLALPVNFVLRSFASESDDYYDKSQGGDGEDYYEKKDWSDLNRPAQDVDVKINPSNISDIDGIVNIITKPSNSPILKALSSSKQNIKEKSKRQSIDKDLEVKKLQDDSENIETPSQNEKNEENNEDEVNKDNKDEEFTNDNKKENIEESDEEIENESKEKVEKLNANNKDETTDKEKEHADDEEDSTEKQKEDEAKAEEQRQNEEKKAKILSSVDELKERHAKEQQRISEKVKEEEMLKDELDREFERSGNNKHDDYDKYTHFNSKWRKLTDDIDFSEEDEEPVYKNKYEIHPYKSTTTSTTIISTTLRPKKQTTRKRKKNKTVATAKLSVYRNPNLYTINDEEYGTTTVKSTKPKIQSPRKFSSRYSAAGKEKETDARISLVPADDSKDGEPTLFYPKKRRNMRKPKTTTPIPDTTADSSQETSSLTETRISSDLSGINPSAPAGTEPSDTYISASHTAPSGDVAPDATASDSSDSTQASSSKKEEAKEDNYHREKGGGKETSEEHKEIHEEHGKKAYEGVHKETKTNKGHHDKEDVLDKYDDHGALDKKHHKEDKHFGAHHHEEHGKKHAKYEESGKHSKGHSTKGSHDIHKKEEYEKKVEFFEEEGDSDDEEHNGGYHKEKEHSSGGHFKKGSLAAAHAGHSKGVTGHFVKGGHGNHHKGHKASEGKDSHGRHRGSHHNFEGHSGGKKWVYHHGHPARNANLIIIDRRADAYQHGPLYYG